MTGHLHTEKDVIPPGEDEEDDDDVYTPYPEEEEERKPQIKETAKTSTISQERPISRRSRRLAAENEDFQANTNNAIEPYKRSGSSQTGPIARSPAQSRGIIREQQSPETRQLQKKGKDEDSGLKLRLDLNLDIELELKARIRGDLTLALLS